MDDKVSKLKAIAELRDSGILTQGEFEEQKAKILSESTSFGQPPSPNYGTTMQMGGMHKGSGPIPVERRSGWLYWIIYIGISIAGTIVSSAMYVDAIDSGDCYEDSYYGGYYANQTMT